MPIDGCTLGCIARRYARIRERHASRGAQIRADDPPITAPVIASVSMEAFGHTQWKLQLIAFVSNLATINGGFLLIPKASAMFGREMIPGPSAVFSGFGIPMIAALSIGMVWLRKIDRHKGINALVLGGGSIFIWALAFGRLH